MEKLGEEEEGSVGTQPLHAASKAELVAQQRFGFHSSSSFLSKLYLRKYDFTQNLHLTLSFRNPFNSLLK